jgi:hypothetical protein
VKDQLDLVAAENAQLLKELKYLRARVAAFESSRWWRIHPGLRLRKLLSPGPVSVEHAPANREEVADDVVDRFRAEVLSRGDFRHDWFTEHVPAWEPIVRQLEGRPSKFLELGSFEGLSAAFVLWRLPEAEITCVDTFAGGLEHGVRGVDVTELERTFDNNVALFDSSRVRKVVGQSAPAMLDLIAADDEFDLVYVDASHLALDVLVDAALAWQLVTPEGFMVFDDYDWPSPLGDDPLFRPGPAIDAFLGLVDGHCEVLEKRRQAVLRKRPPSAEVSTAAGG